MWKSGLCFITESVADRQTRKQNSQFSCRLQVAINVDEYMLHLLCSVYAICIHRLINQSLRVQLHRDKWLFHNWLMQIFEIQPRFVQNLEVFVRNSTGSVRLMLLLVTHHWGSLVFNTLSPQRNVWVNSINPSIMQLQ